MKCDSNDTVGDLKKLIAAQTGTDASKIVLRKWYANTTSSPLAGYPSPSNPTHRNLEFPHRYTVYKDHITLGDYEINDGMSLEMY